MSTPSVDEIRRLIAAVPVSRLGEVLETHAEDPRAGVQSAVRSGRVQLERARAEHARLDELYELELRLRREGCCRIAGVDEVGRGALAGPLTAAAVVLPESPRIDGLDDSKRLTPERREVLAEHVMSVAISVSISHVSPTEIDSIGIGNAVRRAMVLAIGQLPLAPDHVVVDGLPVGIAEQETAVVRGDGTVAAIAAASIVAKVARDALMRSLAVDYPRYGFDVNKGYGTSDHIDAITRHGLTPLHRRSFGPCGGTLPLF